MNAAQWAAIDDHVLSDGGLLLDHLESRGLRAPSLLAIEQERVRRGIRRGLHYRPRRRTNLGPAGGN